MSRLNVLAYLFSVFGGYFFYVGLCQDFLEEWWIIDYYYYNRVPLTGEGGGVYIAI